MIDQNPHKFTRRDFLMRGAAGVAALGFGSPILTSCGDGKEKPLIIKLNKTEEEAAVQIGSEFMASLNEQYGMQIEKELILSSGLPVTIITDGNINIDEAAFEEAFHLGLDDIANLPDGEYKDGMKRIVEGVERSEFSGRKLLLAVSGNPQTCRSPLGLFSTIPAGVNRVDFCTKTSETLNAYDVEEIGADKPPLLMMMYLNAGVDSEGTFRPNDSDFAFSAEESLSVQLSHEALHVYFSLLGMPRGSAEEEEFILQSDKQLNERFQQDPSARPLPFTYKT